MLNYRTYRNLYNKLIKAAKKNYYTKKLQDVKNDVKKTWELLNDIISKHKKSVSYPEELKIQQPNSFVVNLTEPKQIAEFFNNFFSTVGLRTASTFETTDSVNPLNSMTFPEIQESFFMAPTDPQEVLKVALSIKSKSSTGHDGLSNKVVKEIIPFILTPLTHIFNLSLETGIVPHIYKTAKVIPIYKSGNKSDPNNYRPISLLPAFSKILEKIVCDRLFQFLLKHNVLSSKQYGFIRGRSTEQAMLDILLQITKAIEEKKFTLGIFLDLSKAFDSLSHNILLDKMAHYGIRGIPFNWFKSYLSDRQQFVQTNVTSSYQPINYGVPQGSVLGPLLFLIFINDMPQISKLMNFVLFADDTTALYSSPSINDLFQTTNKEIDNLGIWFDTNKLLINVSKTNYVLFTSLQKEQHDTTSYDHNVVLNPIH